MTVWIFRVYFDWTGLLERTIFCVGENKRSYVLGYFTVVLRRFVDYVIFSAPDTSSELMRVNAADPVLQILFVHKEINSSID